MATPFFCRVIAWALGGVWATGVAAQTPSAAWQTACETRLPITVIEVRTVTDAIRFNHDRSVTELSTTPRRRGERTYTLGLTEMRTGTSVDVRSTTMKNPSEGLACTRPHLVVTLSLAPHTVSVAREFPEGGCAYRHIVEHEMRHVEVNRRTLEDTATRLRQGLLESFGNKVYYGTPAELRQRLTQHIRDEWMPWIKEQMQRTQQLHREIDTPEEFARNHTVCDGEITRVLGATR